MGKLLKYEFKGNFKLFFGVFISAILLCLALLVGVDNGELRFSLGILIWFAVYVILLIFSISSFKNELYEERGYLTFTLPVSGRKFLASKMIVAFVWFAFCYILSIISIDMIAKNSLSQNILSLLKNLLYSKSFMIVSIFSSLLHIFTFILMIYFSITITRIGLKSGKLSGFVAFIAFLILNFIIIRLQMFIINISPYSLSFKSDSLQMLSGSVFSISFNNNSLISISHGVVQLNIAGTIFSILIFVGMFIATSYLIENKIDL
ncbi:hypothetical protein CLTEP_04800 [Clostridium tepidiprofundi DSM 19306]|uniref:ABC-2 family transporter protein n=1 Tax=Clostridium tepidiprofundi DSM 19306 TaxID=1121338 RepID=A0A151B6H1_9CLOT|nr:hypothetical protein [Clostridium tepidiprofundi]KYH35541.1 hypothetical protein CLTEP_04800 [Clostridium tepidiprofundi DSM 19306]